MSQEAILNIVLSTVVAITAIFALFQTHKQIKISNKQNNNLKTKSKSIKIIYKK